MSRICVWYAAALWKPAFFKGSMIDLHISETLFILNTVCEVPTPCVGESGEFSEGELLQQNLIYIAVPSSNFKPMPYVSPFQCIIPILKLFLNQSVIKYFVENRPLCPRRGRKGVSLNPYLITANQWAQWYHLLNTVFSFKISFEKDAVFASGSYGLFSWKNTSTIFRDNFPQISPALVQTRFQKKKLCLIFKARKVLFLIRSLILPRNCFLSSTSVLCYS